MRGGSRKKGARLRLRLVLLQRRRHLPQSTLLMLVSAFADPSGSEGREKILRAYREAVAQRYRFYSYGDAMLIHGGMEG